MFRLIAVMLTCASLIAQMPQPERKVTGSVISSSHDPAVRIELPRTMTYLGASRWPLYDVADCELHLFVDADRDKVVRRLYWVQFEGYLASKPNLKYQYDSPRTLRLGGMDFYVDTWVRPMDTQVRAGSDSEHMRRLVTEHGYRFPAGMMSVRMVHLLDATKRKELMIIYSEDLGPTGSTAAQLAPDGTANGRWAQIEQGLVQRAQSQITLMKQ